MSDLRIGGIISGLDTVNLVNQLMQIERRPVVLMENKISTCELKKSLWGEINTSLLALKNAVSPLLNWSAVLAKTAASSDEKIVAVTADSSAATGTYRILSINKLATPTRVKSGAGEFSLGVGGKIDPTKAVGTSDAKFGTRPTSGFFTINGVKITIDANTDSLDAIITRINEAGAGVTAGYDETTDKLKITASTPGGALNLGSAGDTSNFLSATGLLAAARVGDTKESTIHLGHINPASTMASTNFARAFSGLDPDGNGKFQINGVEISYNVNSDSLNEVISRINASTAGVTAAYDATTDKLVLTSKTTGSTAIAFEDVQGNFFAVMNMLKSDPNPANNAVITYGENAEFTIEGYNDGNPITRTSNTISDVIAGVTLTLKSVTATPVTVTVSPDVDAAVGKIRDFVNKYNDTVRLLNQRLREAPVEEPRTDSERKVGLLRGDYNLTQIKLNLGNKVMDPVAGLPGEMSRLSQIGITTVLEESSYGKVAVLSLDETKLREALTNNPDGVARIFFNDADLDGEVDKDAKGAPTEDGVAVRLDYYLQQLTDTKTTSYGGRSVKAGLIPRQQDVLQGQIDDLEEQIEAFEERLAKREEQLYAQFTAMEQALSLLQSQSQWLTMQLASITGTRG